MSKGKIFVLSSPSGSGKTTLRDIALEKLDSLDKIITMTSRSPRSGELDGVDYHFRTREEMVELRKNDGFVESVESYGNLYGTPRFEIDKVDAGKNIIIILDVYGKVEFSKEYDVIGIFITPPSDEVLQKRIFSRKEGALSKDDLCEYVSRLERANTELEYAKSRGSYKYYIDGNGSIEECSSELIGIITSELRGDG